ncbi:ABC transporter permease [Microbacterium sp. SORGH_AS_0862]|uniref:ABC transporter permease n=1 Tax=Microbacterium sp. SORGH_AS_0862 TaxID=3041789 RepID=UPI0027D91992|nr:ABC transporter permease [Microbacterium sp. SORGH_AS_0862]
MRSLLVGAASLATGLFAWWALAEYGGLPTYVLPSPGEVLARAQSLLGSGSLQLNTAQTLAEVLQGAVIGALAGVVLAMLFYRVPVIRRLLLPVVVVMQVTPKISIAPLLILWIGLGIGSKITLVALVVFYPVLITMLARLDALPSAMLDLAKILNMGAMRRAVRMELPFTLPALASGLGIGMLAGVTAAVIGEFIGATAGLGFLEKQGQDNDDVALVIVALLILSFIGWALFQSVRVAERLLTRRYA